MAQPATLERSGSAAGRPAPPEAVGRALRWRSLIERRELAIFIVAIALFLYFTVASDHFVGYSNFVTLTQFLAPIAVIGVGEVMLLTCGEVDLSAGTAFVAFPFFMYFFWSGGMPLPVAIVVTLVVAAAFGAINGLIRILLDVPSFVTTLGTLFALDGVMLISSSGQQETVTLNGFGGNFLGVYPWSEVLWALVMVILMYLVLHRTRFGQHTVATGGNGLGAAEAGIPVRRVKLWCFMMSSVLAAMIGIIDSVRITTLDPGNDGTLEMFYAISAAVIGGTALTGGRGTVPGAAVGAIVLGILYDGLNILGISAYWFELILGVAILGAMIANVQLHRVALGRFGRKRVFQ
jgi:simple sugar transport system permease protein